MIASRTWDIPGYPIGPGTSDFQSLGHHGWLGIRVFLPDYLELGTCQDIQGNARVFLGLLGPGTSDFQSLGHPG